MRETQILKCVAITYLSRHCLGFFSNPGNFFDNFLEMTVQCWLPYFSTRTLKHSYVYIRNLLIIRRFNVGIWALKESYLESPPLYIRTASITTSLAQIRFFASSQPLRVVAANNFADVPLQEGRTLRLSFNIFSIAWHWHLISVVVIAIWVIRWWGCLGLFLSLEGHTSRSCTPSSWWVKCWRCIVIIGRQWKRGAIIRLPSFS